MKHWLRTILFFSVMIALGTPADARAFYWRNWPGSQVASSTQADVDAAQADSGATQTPRVQVGSTTGILGDVVEEVVDVKEDGISKDPVETDDQIVNMLSPAPEPSTLIATLVGLAAIGIMRRRVFASSGMTHTHQ